VIADTLEKMPHHLLRDLRRYQVHQFRDGRFELRIVTPAPMPDDFERLIDAAWKVGTQDDPKPLQIVRVDDIPLGPSGKRLDFSSDFFVDAEATH
jgi:hypothetical protein